MGRAIIAISGSAVALLPRPFAAASATLATRWRELTRHLFNDSGRSCTTCAGPARRA